MRNTVSSNSICGGNFLKLFLRPNEKSEYPKYRMLILVCDYIDVTQFDNYMFSYHIRCVLKTFLTLQFNRLNTVYFKAMSHCVCCVWDSLEWVWGSECGAGGFVVGVCVCDSLEWV